MKKINLLIISVSLILSACTNKNTYKTTETEMEKNKENKKVERQKKERWKEE